MKAFLGFLFFSIILCVAGWNLYVDHERAKVELVDAERSVGQIKMVLADRQAQLEALKRNYELQRRIYDTNQALAEARSVMTELQDNIESQKRVYQGILETRRATAQGSKLGTVELADGRSLRNVKLLNFDDTTLSLQTEDGILKIKAQDLPPHLQEYFRFDLIEPEIEPVLITTNPFEGNYTPSAGGEFKYTADSMILPAGESSADKLKTLNEEVVMLNKRIQALQKGKQAPLIGMDARLKSGSAVFKYRKKARDDKLDREIAVLIMRRKSYEAQRRELQNLSSR